MYPEVACSSKLLYSIYTGREAQCNIINNHTTILFFWHGNQSLGFFLILEVFRCLRPRRPWGDRSRLHRGPRPCFAADPIDLAAFVALASSCSSRLEVPACRRWGLVVLHSQRMKHLEVAVIHLATTTASTTATAGDTHGCAAARLLEAVGPRRGGGLTASLCSWGGCTARRAPGLTASLYVRQTVPGYRDTLRCTRDYPSITVSL
jgi:hypothetical protein